VQEYLDGAEGRRSVVTTEGRLAYA